PSEQAEMAEVLDGNSVFGRVTPQQKRDMVGALPGGAGFGQYDPAHRRVTRGRAPPGPERVPEVPLDVARRAGTA
ncbi:hypothetical protein ABZZ01_34045, partial [Streptomyces virginiae]|uniref:hypothetical protein n=1 Tax=Streptomyces virginiae TaxID=1961 RepID=UPI0033B677F7